MEVDVRTSLKRPLSFSEDSFEWDSARDELPADIGWNSMKSECDDSAVVSGDVLPVEWAPFGRVRRGKAKRPRLEQSVATTPKKAATDTIAQLEEGDKETATEVVQSISKHSGSFVFESSNNATYAGLIPVPSAVATAKMGPQDHWQLEKLDCKLETLLSSSPSKRIRNITIPVWKTAKRRDRKYEVLNVKREARVEDVAIEDGIFSWTTFANLIKPQFAGMEPNARLAAAKHFTDFLKADLSTTSDA